MKTFSAKASEVSRKWWVIDARNQVLGKVAVKAANLLRGKEKTVFTPHVDTGDFVIVINAARNDSAQSAWSPCLQEVESLLRRLSSACRATARGRQTHQKINPMPQTEEFVATGRRKTSVARIRMMPGSGKIDINGRSFEDYFPTVPLQNVVLQPLQTAKAVNAYDLSINATGGGIMGQAGAAQLAIARALLQVDANLRSTLKVEGLLRRDPRMKERKKSGQPGARKRFQFSKR